MSIRGWSCETVRVNGWRRSRLVRVVTTIPGVGGLPLRRLEAVVLRLRRLYHLGVEYAVRAAAWSRTGQAWVLRGGTEGEAARSALGGAAQLFTPRGLRAFFHPSPLQRERSGSSPLESSHGVDRSALDWAPLQSESESGSPRLRIAVYVSRNGNFFHAEMAELLARALEASGAFDVKRKDETEEPATDVDEHIVVAPHEFFQLGHGARFCGKRYRPFRRRCTLFLAEQPGTKHFARCLPFAVEARLVLDLNPASAEALRKLGLPARFFPAGYLECFEPFSRPQPVPKDGAGAGISFAGALDGTPEDAARERRPIDILFMGVLTARRAAFFSEHAAFFASKRCFFSLPAPHTPLQSGVASTLPTVEATALAQRAKILLQQHDDEFQQLVALLLDKKTAEAEEITSIFKDRSFKQT